MKWREIAGFLLITTATACWGQVPPLTAITNVNTGTGPNTGTGDPAYVAFDKVNTNTLILSNSVAILQAQILSDVGVTSECLDWWNAGSIVATNGQLYTGGWVGLNGNVLAGNAWYASSAMAGNPATYWDGTGGDILTNGTLLGGLTGPYPMTNAGTVFILFREPQNFYVPATSGNFCVMDVESNYTTLSAQFLANVSQPNNNKDESPSLNSYYGGVESSHVDQDSLAPGDDIRLYCFTWSSNNFQTYWDGKLQQNCPNWGFPSESTGPVGFGGILSIGSLYDHAWPFQGYISDVIIFTNALTPLQIDRVSTKLLAPDNRVRNTVLAFTDSVGAGGVSSYPNWLPMLATNMPGWSFDYCSMPGANTLQMLTNVVAFCKNYAPFGGGTPTSTKTVALLWTSYFNPGDTISTVTNDLIAMSTNLQAAGILTVLVDPPSNGNLDKYNGGADRIALNSFCTNNWQQWFNGLLNLANIAAIGASNASTNTFYFPVGGYVGGQPVHPTNSLFALIAPVSTAVIQSVANGNFFVASTNSPPPTANQPWYAEVSTAPGTLFINNNGSWLPQNPTNWGAGTQIFVGGYPYINTTGSSGTSVGIGNGANAAVFSATVGNVGIGQNALNANTNGTDNIAIGVDALENSVSGSGDNISIGFESLLNDPGGDFYQCVMGFQAFQNFIGGGGNANIGIGFEAGYNCTNGAEDIYIGSEGPTSVATENHTMRLGDHPTYAITQTYIAGMIHPVATGGPAGLGSTNGIGWSGTIGVITNATGGAGHTGLNLEITNGLIIATPAF